MNLTKMEKESELLSSFVRITTMKPKQSLSAVGLCLFLMGVVLSFILSGSVYGQEDAVGYKDIKIGMTFNSLERLNV